MFGKYVRESAPCTPLCSARCSGNIFGGWGHALGMSFGRKLPLGKPHSDMTYINLRIYDSGEWPQTINKQKSIDNLSVNSKYGFRNLDSRFKIPAFDFWLPETCSGNMFAKAHCAQRSAPLGARETCSAKHAMGMSFGRKLPHGKPRSDMILLMHKFTNIWFQRVAPKQ